VDSGRPITFDSRSKVSFLTQVFWLVLVSFPTDLGLIGGVIQMSAGIWLSCGDEKVSCCLWFWGVSLGMMVFHSCFGVRRSW